jgi:hypothetical protein
LAITPGGQQALSVQTDGNLLVMMAPASVLTAGKALTDLKVSDLSAASFVDITYDLTAGSGWAEGRTEESITDDRLTSPQSFTQPGREANTLTTQYVYGDETSVADPLLVEKELFVAAVRWAVPHDQEIAANDKFDLWFVKAGIKTRDQAAANAVFTKTQVFYPQRNVVRDHEIAAS